MTIGQIDRGIDDEGNEIHGGIAAIRNAFVHASGDKLTCLSATMSYGEDNAQQFVFEGVRKADGSPFRAEVNVPAGAPAGSYVRAAARKLIEPPKQQG